MSADWTPIPLATKSSKGRSLGASSEELVNLYLVENPTGAPNPFTLYGTPGLKRYKVLDASKPTRGIAALNDTVFAVVGQTLYAVPPSGIVLPVGAIEGAAPVRIVSTGTKLLIVTGAKLYVADISGVQEADTGDFLSVAYQEGYAICAERGTQVLRLSQNDNWAVFPPLDFTTADAQGDINVGGISANNEYWHFKEKSFEVYRNTGASPFPFERQLVVGHGLAAVGSLVFELDRVIWLGQDSNGSLQVYAAAGYRPERISTDAVERSIQEQVSISDAEAFTYAQDGRVFYVLSFANVTWACDLTSNRWSRRETRGLSRWRAHGCVSVNGKTIVGDYQAGVLYELDLKSNTDDGACIQRVITCPKLDAKGRALHMAASYLDCETGVGSLGAEVYAFLQWSDDDGKTYCDPIGASLGKLGDYQTVAMWNRLGKFRKRIMRWLLLDPYFVAVHGAHARLELWL